MLRGGPTFRRSSSDDSAVSPVGDTAQVEQIVANYLAANPQLYRLVAVDDFPPVATSIPNQIVFLKQGGTNTINYLAGALFEPFI